MHKDKQVERIGYTIIKCSDVTFGSVYECSLEKAKS